MSESLSSIAIATAPELKGAWVHRVADPGGTIRNFPFTDNRKRSLSSVASLQRAVGRAYPVAEYGEGVEDELKLSVIIPFDADYSAGVAWWLDVATSGAVICYRDNRGRVLFTTLVDGIDETDLRYGTSISAGMPRIDFSEAL